MSDWIVRLIEQSGYLGIGFLMFLETVFPPIPSELIMPVAGLAAQRGQMNMAGVIAAGTAGAMLGNILWYLAARALGTQRLKPFIKRWGRWLGIGWKDIEKAHDWFERHGSAFVLVGRVVPTARSLISVPAGLLDMRFRSFFLASLIGTALWTAMLAFLGAQLGAHYGSIEAVIGPISILVLVAIGGAYAWRVFSHKPHRD